MNNIMISFKRFLKNKNTVTIIGILVGLGLLYWVYVTAINNAVEPVSVPIAAVEIQPRTEITREMITTISVPAISASDDVITNASEVIGKYSNINCYIPEGSMFYGKQVVKKESLPDSAFDDIKQGEIPYQFAVDVTSTYGNSIFPGNKIDIYMKGIDESGKVMVGRLLSNVEVLAVKDSEGNNVFENTTEERTPSFLLFGLQEELYILLKQTEYLSDYDIELFPVPHGGQATVEGETKIDIQYFVDYINTLTHDLLEEKGTIVEDTTTQETR